VARVSSALGPDLVGVYLTGSFALGGGDASSDCDFLVVTEGGLDAAEEGDLRQLHEEIPIWAGHWARNLEGSYAPRGDLETLAALGRPWLYVDRGHREMELSPHCNTAVVRWVLANSPAVLAGADPRTFCCEVPADALRAAMRPEIESFLHDVKTWAPLDVIWTQRYLVESASRMLYTLERGEVISKQDALDWAADALPAEWRALIEQVRKDRLVAWDSPPRAGSMECAVAFVEYVQARARSGTA
jgi:Aminoglycoside adenylyltransferase, C-terminal domain/Nucleotidyltransferase domain